MYVSQSTVRYAIEIDVSADDKELFDGSPVGVQIMGQRYQEEKVLAMMRALEAALQQL